MQAAGTGHGAADARSGGTNGTAGTQSGLLSQLFANGSTGINHADEASDDTDSVEDLPDTSDAATGTDWTGSVLDQMTRGQVDGASVDAVTAAVQANTASGATPATNPTLNNVRFSNTGSPDQAVFQQLFQTKLQKLLDVSPRFRNIVTAATSGNGVASTLNVQITDLPNIEARYIANSNTIQLNVDAIINKAQDPFGSLVYEMCNASHRSVVNDLHVKIESGYYQDVATKTGKNAALTYATATERLEYQSALDEHQLLQEASKVDPSFSGCDNYSTMFEGKNGQPGAWSTFEGSLDGQIRTGHTKVYVD